MGEGGHPRPSPPPPLGRSATPRRPHPSELRPESPRPCRSAPRDPWPVHKDPHTEFVLISRPGEEEGDTVATKYLDRIGPTALHLSACGGGTAATVKQPPATANEGTTPTTVSTAPTTTVAPLTTTTPPATTTTTAPLPPPTTEAPPPTTEAPPPTTATAASTASCTASSVPADDGYPGDYNVNVTSNQPDQTVTASSATDTYSYTTDGAGSATVFLWHQNPGESVTVTVGGATCSTNDQ